MNTGFDGPICSVFAGLPAPVVAEQLRVVLADGGHTDLPESVATTDDPFDVFRYSATLGDNEARYVEAAFTALEVEAITTAEPTPGAHDLIHAWHRSGRPLAIVSNNSDSAINMYLNMHCLRFAVDAISARRDSLAANLKPGPKLVLDGISTILSNADTCLFLGDSESDLTAALATGATFVALANKSEKFLNFRRSGANCVITNLGAFEPFPR